MHFKLSALVGLPMARSLFIGIWKEVFEFNGMKYLATSQWYERHREPFTRWITRLKEKKL